METLSAAFELASEVKDLFYTSTQRLATQLRRLLDARKIDRTCNGQLQQKLKELEAFIEGSRSELATWEQHLTDLQGVIDELRVDAAVCSRIEAHGASQIVLNAVYSCVEK